MPPSLEDIQEVMREALKPIAGRDQQTPWRICDSCVSREAIVFCLSCNVYVCEEDLKRHITPGLCKFLSVSAAREISTAALTERKPQARVLGWL